MHTHAVLKTLKSNPFVRAMDTRHLAMLSTECAS